MANFLLLYSGGSGMPQTEAEQKAIIDVGVTQLA